MSGSLMGMTGMGSNGLGIGSAASLPPGLLQLLMQRMQGGGQMTPGAALMGGPQIGTQPQRPMSPNMTPQMPAQGPPQQMPGLAQAMGGGNLQALLAALKGQQQGVQPQQGATAASLFGANGLLPASLQAWLGGGAAMPGAGGTLQPQGGGLMPGGA